MGLLEILLLSGFLIGLTIFLLLHLFADFSWIISSIITFVIGIFVFVFSMYFLSGFEGIPIGSIGGAVTLIATVFLVFPYLWHFVKNKIQQK